MSNTQSAQQIWDDLAKSIGFDGEKAMWDQLYVAEKRTIKELSKTIGYGTATIDRRIKLSGVTTRARGGANSPAKVYDKYFHLDQRAATLATPEEVAKLCDASIHSIYRIRREMF